MLLNNKQITEEIKNEKEKTEMKSKEIKKENQNMHRKI